MPLSASHIEKLGLFWSTLAPDTRQRVLNAARSAAKSDPAQVNLAGLLDHLEQHLPRDEATIKRERFFVPLAPLTGNPEDDPPSRAYFSPAFKAALWRWLESEMTPAFVDSLPEPDADESEWNDVRIAAGRRLIAFVDAASEDRKQESRIVSLWGAGGAETVKQAATLLIYHAELMDALADFPKEVTDFDPELCIFVRDAYEDLTERVPEAGVWLLLLVMTRLTKTAQIFRAVSKIGRRDDDQMVSKTDLAAVGDAVLKDAEFYATRVRRLPETIEDAEVAVSGLAAFVTVTVGMTREFGIRKDGRWGKTLFSLRAQVSSDLEKQIAATQKSLEAALPLPKKGKRGVMVPIPTASEAIIARSAAQLHFLGGAGDWAAQAAIGSVHKKAEDAAIHALEECSGHLINLLQHSNGDTQALASSGLDVIARLQDALGQSESASLTRRRNAAAMVA